eukprot:TRINITY_DN5954_c0_g1_i2.p1 TRINITY_DN5954_c0_g1~~TRINITY_DN5954_c0_g1_i2.p1  ORF type:complete len:232 (-),score=28.87 TRINITY_DN5954_c0_g1_i2:184-879(-)
MASFFKSFTGESNTNTNASANDFEEVGFEGETNDSTISAPPAEEELDTLDEPVWRTVLRDVSQIAIKLAHVIFPFRGAFQRVAVLRDWDLWGPLALSLILAITLSMAMSDRDQQSLMFAGIFVIVWVGAAIITVNAILLGGKINFFQSVCVLGYCLGPLDVAALIVIWWSNFIFHIVTVSICFLWSVFASWGFVAAMLPKRHKGRTVLAVYPVVLFYMVIAWLIVMAHYVD